MKKTGKGKQIAPERLEAYRAYKPMALPEFVAALRSFDDHRRCFAAIGEKVLEAAAERAWVGDAIIFAALPAPNRAQAEEKCLYLQAAVDEWLLASPLAGEHVACAGMVMAAIKVEAERWGLTVRCGRKVH